MAELRPGHHKGSHRSGSHRGRTHHRHKKRRQIFSYWSLVKITVVATILLGAVAVLFRYSLIYAATWTFGGFFLGATIAKISIGANTLLPNLLLSRTRMLKAEKSDELEILKKCCPVCGHLGCIRHRPELNLLSLKPWLHLKIPAQADESIEEFLNHIMRRYVYVWHREMSKDESFPDEIRYTIRFIIATLHRRLLKVDLAHVIQKVILRNVIRHLNYFLEVKRAEEHTEDLTEAVLAQYGENLHYALYSREAELLYLRSFSEKLFSFLLPLNVRKNRGTISLMKEIVSGAVLMPTFDTLANPNFYNGLIVSLLAPSEAVPQGESKASHLKAGHEEPNRDPNRPVTILSNLAHTIGRPNSCLTLNLDEILKDPDQLYPFMQFMKSEASVNVLQFYLSLVEFNENILNPELSNEKLHKLHQQLKEMYKNYLDAYATDRIQVDPDIVANIEAICEGPVDGVISLQTTTPLFRAHDHMYNLLESTFLPLFHQSDDYYQMVIGERNLKLKPSDSSESMTQSEGMKTVSSFSSQSGRAKDKNAPDVDSQDDECSDTSNIELPSELELITTLRRSEDGPRHDLSAWRVCIPYIHTKPDPENAKKQIHVFVIEVRRIDVLDNDFESSQWTVERRYQEFYALEQKLTEFHGDLKDKLPSKKAFGTKSVDFLELRKHDFQAYIQQLLTMPTLRGSELLYQFLTSENLFHAKFLPDINFGKFVKSGAMKFIKERGQHLGHFLASLHTCVDVIPPKPSTHMVETPEAVTLSMMRNPLFWNNADKQFETLMPKNESRETRYSVEGIFDTVYYVCEHLFQVEDWRHILLTALRIFFKRTIDTATDFMLSETLKQVINGALVKDIVNGLTESLFFDNSPPVTEEFNNHQKEEALELLLAAPPPLASWFLGKEPMQEGLRSLFHMLQHPRLNKQLIYAVTDELLDEIFVEMKESSI